MSNVLDVLESIEIAQNDATLDPTWVLDRASKEIVRLRSIVEKAIQALERGDRLLALSILRAYEQAKEQDGD